MRPWLNRFFASRRGIVAAGATIGVLAPLLQKLGNPKNMGICVACFERDIAGALGLHRAGAAQYIRPEIIALVLGSTLAALAFGEFKARAGSAPIIRFVLGAFAMIGALVFLGCPWRALLRLAGGDLNALLGLLGFTAGVGVGVIFLRQGYSLGRSHKTHSAVGWVFPLMMIGLLVLLVFQPQFTKDGPIFFSKTGPGSMHAPILISLVAGLLIGFVAQRTRFCTMGAIRDVILIRDTHLIRGVGTLLVVALIMNLMLGQFNPGFAAQPIAHSNQLWNVLGMVLVGLASTLAGGCPGRQLFLSGEGDGDAAIFVLGMLTGAAFAHNLALTGATDSLGGGALRVGGPSSAGMGAVVLGLLVCTGIGLTMRESTHQPGEVNNDHSR